MEKCSANNDGFGISWLSEVGGRVEVAGGFLRVLGLGLAPSKLKTLGEKFPGTMKRL